MPVEAVRRHFQGRHGQFAADDQRGPADPHPAAVDLPRFVQPFAGLQRKFFVVCRVEDPHDLAIDADRAGDPDLLSESPRDPLGNARLAVARRAEEEQSAAGVHRRSEAIEHPLAEHQIAEGLPQAFGRGRLRGQRLGLDACNVVFQRDRSGTEIGAVVPVALGPFAAQIGKLVQKIVHRRAGAIGEQLVVLQLAQQFVDEDERQLELVGHFPAGGVAAGQQVLQGQRLDEAVVQPGGTERLRFLGHEAVGPGRLARDRGRGGGRCGAGRCGGRRARGQ